MELCEGSKEEAVAEERKPVCTVEEEEVEVGCASVPTPGRPGLPPNTSVLARWTDKQYYPGRTLTYNESMETYQVQFEDGDIRNVKCGKW